jgi:hypothetical protein
MYNSGRFNEVGFNLIEDVEEYSPLIVRNNLTMVLDTDIIPVEYIGERLPYSNSPWMPQSGFYPNQWLVASNLYLYFAGDDGYVYRYGVGKTDAGQAINAYYVLSAITLEALDLKKRLRWIDIDYEKMTDSFVRVLYKIDDADEWSLLCELDQGEVKYPFVGFPRPLFRKISIKFEASYTGCDFVINGITLDMAIRGQQKEFV